MCHAPLQFNLSVSQSLTVLSSPLYQVNVSSGHARLMEPVSRASMWRLGYPNPADYNDNEGFCGGFEVI